MCRLYGFRASQPTKVECSLVYAQNALLSQSESDERGLPHPDGWGIASYRDGVPHVQRRASAAFEDLHFGLTAERSYARTVVAHVRQATVGPLAIENTQPFMHGRWVFAHNGTLRAIDSLRPELDAETAPDLLAGRSGGTDSEAVFYWLLTRMREAGIGELEPAALPAVSGVLSAGVAELSDRSAAAGETKPTRLNIILTDGSILLATRWRHSLYWVTRHGVRDCEICGIPHVHQDSAVGYEAVAVASEPITQEDWQEVPEASILAVDDRIRATIVPT
jgi:glutamine amidotransferase